MSTPSTYLTTLFSLDSKTALVTGGTRGIGAGFAIALASAGAKILLAVRPGSDASATVSAIRTLGRTAHTFPCDLSSAESVAALLPAILSAGHSVDILVNSAGYHHRRAAESYTDAEVAGIWQVNVGAMFSLCRAVVQHWFSTGRAAGGKIVNTASVLSFTGGTGLAAYTATKGAIAQMTKTMSNEWAPRGVRVNAIAPGYIRTDMTQDLQEDEAKSAEVLRRTPVGRWGIPEDLAAMVVFLAGPGSDFVTGAVMVVDGGYTAR